MQHERHRAARITEGCFAQVIRAFMASPKFNGYSANTRDNWGRQLRLAERPDTLGALSVHAIRPALVQAFLDGLSDRPGKQGACLRALKQLEKWAIVRDLLPHPITTGVEIEDSDGGHVPWTREQVELGELQARKGFSRIIPLISFSVSAEVSARISARVSDFSSTATAFLSSCNSATTAALSACLE